MQQAIAILDSGVGGLTVVKEVMRQLPREKIIYFGDTARTPYGPRPAREVLAFTRQIVDYLLQFQPKLIVIACNTATAVALDEIRDESPVPVIGVIYPGARAAIKMTRNGKIGVIGTEGTVKSGSYEKALRSINPNLELFSSACPLLVPLVEKGLYHQEEAIGVVRNQLAPLLDIPIDTLILGCTHYPFLADAISKVMGPGVELISSAEETAREIGTILHHSGQLAHSEILPIHQFHCSGDPAIFRKIAQEWLGDEVAVSPVVWQVTKIV
ncbi:MAG TPA: glutamate racemase [Bacilli bacterium]